MQNELISKKELLSLTGISYGQLYRWKRERLIPEDWFIKQSSFTGQETFFPRRQVLSRIEEIMSLKDNYSLEDISRLLSPGTHHCVRYEQLCEIGEIDPIIISGIPEVYRKNSFRLLDIAFLIFISRNLAETDTGIPAFLDACLAQILGQSDGSLYTVLFRVDNSLHALILKKCAETFFDEGVAVIDSCELSQITGTLNIKYHSLFAD